MNPRIPKMIKTGITEFMVCETENEWFMRSHIKKASPPKPPINRPVNTAYLNGTCINFHHLISIIYQTKSKRPF